MQIGYFTERPYRWLPEELILKNRAFSPSRTSISTVKRRPTTTITTSTNIAYAEELGFDALALNEHHGNPICMGSVMNVEASILARITSRAKIVLVGNPLAGHQTSAADGRRAGRDRSHLARPPGHRLGARRGQ